jgi:cytochrome c5
MTTFPAWPAGAVSAISINLAAQEPTHAEIISRWNAQNLARGKQLYETICITCHGTPKRKVLSPTSRPFWKEPFKNGNDPFSMYKTPFRGLGPDALRGLF